MFEKAGKFYADWRDKSGQRKRKSFNTAKAARVFEQEQKEATHPKPKGRAQQLPRYSTPAQGAPAAVITISTRRDRSSPSPGHSNQSNSRPRTSTTPTGKSSKAQTATQPARGGQQQSAASSVRSGKTTAQRS